MIYELQRDGSYLFYHYIERYDSLFKRRYYGYNEYAAKQKFREELKREIELLKNNNQRVI